jgi:hypothetical protein
VYVPDAAQVAFFGSGDNISEDLILKLKRMSALGSAWATAVLAHDCLVPGPDGRRNVEQSRAYCNAFRYRNDPYVLYISAWTEVYGGDGVTAISRLQASAVQGFAPAMVDLLTFALMRPAGNALDRGTLISLIAVACRTHHKAAQLYACQAYATGYAGLWRRALGLMLMPYAVFKYIVWLRLSPLTEDVFIFRPRARNGLFKGHVRTQ